jgi:hypothetical protein
MHQLRHIVNSLVMWLLAAFLGIVVFERFTLQPVANHTLVCDTTFLVAGLLCAVNEYCAFKFPRIYKYVDVLGFFFPDSGVNAEES